MPASVPVDGFAFFHYQPCPAHGAFHQAGQHADPFRFILFITDGTLLPLSLYPFPHFFRDDRFLLSLDCDFFPLVLFCSPPVRPAEIYDLPAVKRIVQHTGRKIPVKGTGASFGNPPVPMVIQPPYYCGQLHFRFQILGVDQSDNLRFPRLHCQAAALIPVSERRGAARPASLHHLLHPPGHKLHPDVLPFNLRHSGQDGKGQPPALGGTVNTVFHTHQIHAIVQKRLDGFQNIRGIAPEAGQFKYQHIRDLILLTGDVLHHLHKGRPSGNALPGPSGVTIFARDFKVFILRVLMQAFLLRFQAVALRLSSRGNPGVNVAFLFHVLTSFGCSLSHGSPCMINISESGIPANSQNAQGFSLKTMRNAQNHRKCQKAHSGIVSGHQGLGRARTSARRQYKKQTARMTAGKDMISGCFFCRSLRLFFVQFFQYFSAVLLDHPRHKLGAALHVQGSLFFCVHACVDQFPSFHEFPASPAAGQSCFVFSCHRQRKAQVFYPGL